VKNGTDKNFAAMASSWKPMMNYGNRTEPWQRPGAGRRRLAHKRKCRAWKEMARAQRCASSTKAQHLRVIRAFFTKMLNCPAQHLRRESLSIFE
jgi:hypothetical protein